MTDPNPIPAQLSHLIALRDRPWPASEKNAVYHERNQLVALLARVYPSGVRKTVIEGWDPEWENCVYIDTPAGQMAWHFNDAEMPLFAGLPPYDKPWDGHTTEEKYARLAFLRSMTQPVVDDHLIPPGWRLSSIANIGERWQTVLVRAPDGPVVSIRGLAMGYGVTTSAAILAACTDARQQDGA